MEEEKLNDQELARRAKLPRYEELGVDAFGSRYEWKDSIKDLRAKYGSLTEEELAEKQIPVNVAGRLMSIRRMGKASFVNIKDEYGNMQAWLDSYAQQISDLMLLLDAYHDGVVAEDHKSK